MCNLRNYGIILASGTGSRCNSDIPKQFIKIAGKTILEHTIEIFEKAKEIDYIFVVMLITLIILKLSILNISSLPYY